VKKEAVFQQKSFQQKLGVLRNKDFLKHEKIEHSYADVYSANKQMNFDMKNTVLRIKENN